MVDKASFQIDLVEKIYNEDIIAPLQQEVDEEDFNPIVVLELSSYLKK